VALELLDNLPHDKLRVPRDASGGAALAEAHAAMVGDGADGADGVGRWEEEFRPLEDASLRHLSRLLELDTHEKVVALHDAMVERPTVGGGRSVPLAARLQRWLRPVLGGSSAHTDVYVPTGCWRLLDALRRAAPEQQLTLADFSWMPPQPSGAVNAPVVQSQRRGVSRDHGGDVFAAAAAGGECDILFATHFESLESLCVAAGHTDVQTVSSATFMSQYATLSETETRCGYNPLLEDFANTSFLTTGGEELHEERKRPGDLLY